MQHRWLVFHTGSAAELESVRAASYFLFCSSTLRVQALLLKSAVHENDSKCTFISCFLGLIRSVCAY